jgi:hypothetical protein
LLKDATGGDGNSSARKKTVTVLTHIWCTVPLEASQLRDRAIHLLATASGAERLGLHWALMMATYSLFADVATTVGKLLALHQHAVHSQVRRRVVESWGDRSTVSRAVARILRSMVAWDILNDTQTPGVYMPPPRLGPITPSPGILLLEAVLIDADDHAIPADTLLNHPALFPFQLDLNPHDLRKAPTLRIDRQGVDVDVVRLNLARSSCGPAPKHQSR